MKMDLKTGASIASAVALLLGAAVPTAAAAKSSSKEVKCTGVNDCKGKGSCSGADNSCSGKNDCKGKGWVKEKSAKACTKAGGKVVAETEKAKS
jgi:uncharacterized membrane protein